MTVNSSVRARTARAAAVMGALALAALGGSGSAHGAAARAAGAPTNSVPPTVSGALDLGQTLAANPGTWNSPSTPVFTYQWERCIPACAAIVPAETASTYTVEQADIGHTLRVRVTATNVDGGTTAASAETLLVTSQRIAALGDSITAAWGAATGPSADHDQLAESWSTGSDAAVDSHLARLAELFDISAPAAVDVQNNAASGQSVVTPPDPTLSNCGLLAQVDGSGTCSDADSTHPIPALATGLDYVTIEGGSADLCGGDITTPGQMVTAAAFGDAIQEALAALEPKLSPHGVVLVASIPNWYGLWQDFPTVDPGRPPFACPLLFSAGADASTRAAVSAMTIAYNAELADRCALFAFCRYDDGAVYDLRFGLDDLSPVDAFHLSPLGQAKIAEAAWNIGWFSGSDPSLSGTPQVGQTLSAVAGTWISSRAADIVRSWWRCPAGNCTSPVAVAGDVSAYTPVSADVGATIFVTETATNGLGTASRSSAPSGPVAPAPLPPAPSGAVAPTPAPPAPTPASVGGGGGADLALTLAATGRSADSIAYALTVAAANGGSGSNLVLTIQLPSGVTAVSESADRGSGCSGVTTLTCQLDWISGSLVAHVNVIARVATTDAFTTSASVTQTEPDPNPSNNSATLTTPASAPLPARLPTIGFGTTPVGLARVARVRRLVVVSTSFTAANADGLAISLLDARTGLPLVLLPGSRVGGAITGKPHTVIRSRIGVALVTVALRVPRAVIRHPGRYSMRLVLSASGGSSTTVTMHVTDKPRRGKSY